MNPGNHFPLHHNWYYPENSTYQFPTSSTSPTSSSSNYASYNLQPHFQNPPAHVYNPLGYSSPPISPDQNAYQSKSIQNQSVALVPHNPFHSSSPNTEKIKPDPSSLKQIQEMAQKIQSLEQQLKDNYQSYKIEYESVRDANKKIGETNQTLCKKNEKLETQVSNLETKLKKAKENNKFDCASWKKDVLKWKEKFNKEESQCLLLLGDKTVLVQKVKEIEEEIKVLKERVKSEEKAKQDYSNDVTELVFETKRLEQVAKENEEAHGKELESQKKEYTNKIAEYHEQVENMKQKCSDFSIQVENLIVEKSEILAQLEAAKEQNSGVCKQMEDLNQENSGLFAEIEKVQQEKSSILIQVEKLKQEKSSLSIEMEKVKQENSSLSMQVVNLQQQNSDLSVQLENQKQENEDLSTKLKTERPERIKCIKGCECEEEILDLWSNYRRVEKEKRKLNTKLEGIEDELASTQSKFHKLEKKLKRKKKEQKQCPRSASTFSSKATQVESQDGETFEAELCDVVVPVQQDNANNATCATVENRNDEEEVLHQDQDKQLMISNLKRKIDSFKNLRPQLRKMMEKDKEIFTQLQKRMKAFEMEAEREVQNHNVQTGNDKDNDNIGDSENEQVEETSGSEKQKIPCLTRPPLSKLNN
ncbi:unnamed protein product [Orchesella dallaii]|uniref:Uncharacterized protein n=1 Tax=Orchesella dallaii TaxID=48710 RepID=A0ABP1RHS0_9HEXA